MALEGVRGQRHTLAALYPGIDPVTIVQEAGWATGPVWTGAENLAPTGIRYPDPPASSQLLYRLRYPAYTNLVYISGYTWTFSQKQSGDLINAQLCLQVLHV